MNSWWELDIFSSEQGSHSATQKQRQWNIVPSHKHLSNMCKLLVNYMHLNRMVIFVISTLTFAPKYLTRLFSQHIFMYIYMWDIGEFFIQTVELKKWSNSLIAVTLNKSVIFCCWQLLISCLNIQLLQWFMETIWQSHLLYDPWPANDHRKHTR